MKNMKQVITEYIKSVGADGLCNPDLQCGCSIDDVCCCESNPSYCVPAKSHIVTQADLEDDRLSLCDPEIGDTVYIAMNPEQSTKRGI